MRRLHVAVVKVIALVEGQPDQQNTDALAALVAVVVLAVASLATWIPAQRAARVDPVAMLRAE